MTQAPKFQDVANRFEVLVQRLHETDNFQERKNLLLKMSRTIRELDGFVQQYLNSIGPEPSSRIQRDAMSFAKQLLDKPSE